MRDSPEYKHPDAEVLTAPPRPGEQVPRYGSNMSLP
jgi:hypothetical protein